MAMLRILSGAATPLSKDSARDLWVDEKARRKLKNRRSALKELLQIGKSTLRSLDRKADESIGARCSRRAQSNCGGSNTKIFKCAKESRGFQLRDQFTYQTRSQRRPRPAMNGDEFKTPLNRRYNALSSRSTATKRDSLAAELEKGTSFNSSDRELSSNAIQTPSCRRQSASSELRYSTRPCLMQALRGSC